MNELHFADKLRQHLNRGLREIDPATADRLSAARRAALARHEQVAARAVAHPALAAADTLFSFRFGDHRFSQTLAAVALLLCAFYSTFWIAERQARELGSIDSAILSDELPIGAFTDKGFAAWLDRESPAK
jgi:hypothetical protein